MKHYIYLESDTLKELESLVNEKASKGYECDGPHTVLFKTNTGGFLLWSTFTQRMVAALKPEGAQR